MTLRAEVLKVARDNPELRAHLVPLLRQASACKVVTGQGRIPYMNAVWEMFVKTYRRIGLILNNPKELLKYDRWEICFHHEVPVAFSCFKKTPFGWKGGFRGLMVLLKDVR